MTVTSEKKGIKHIYQIHRTMIATNLILVWQGEFTQEVMKSVLAMAEKNMEKTGEENKIKRKVFNVMVECLQNIVKHADEEDVDMGSMETGAAAVFMIGKEHGEYIIATGNLIKRDKEEILKNKIAQVNNLDKAGLKALYKEILTTGNISKKGGAGLGFVDIARKSGHKLEFDFETVNDKVSFFSLQIKIGRE